MPKKRENKHSRKNTKKPLSDVSFDEKALINDVLDAEESIIDQRKPKKKRAGKKKKKPRKSRQAKKGLDKIVEEVEDTAVKTGRPIRQELKSDKTKVKKPAAKKRHEKEQQEIMVLSRLKDVLDGARARRLQKSAKKTAEEPDTENLPKADESQIKELFQERPLAQIPEAYKEKSIDELAPARKKLKPEPLRFVEQDDLSHRWELEKAIYNYPKVHKLMILKMTLLTVALAIVFAFVLLKSGFFEPDVAQVMPQTTDTQTTAYKTILVNKSINRTIPDNISFSKYLGSIGNSESDISLTGFLRHSIVKDPKIGISRHFYSIVDDYNESIILTNLNHLQEQLFIKQSTTSDLYNVSGSLRTVNAQLQLRVISISHAQRPSTVITETTTEQRMTS